MKRILPLLVITLLAWGCSKRHKAFTPSEVSFPSPPKDLKASVGDGEINLTWSDTEEVRGFYIYRADSARGKFFKRDSTSNLFFVDAGLLNNQEYLYKLSAYNLKGYEGECSSVISATPSAYDLLIEGGKEYTNQQEVSLIITAPQGASLMMLANDSTLTDGSWEPFSPEKQWTLTKGDGEKFVFAKFKDSKGVETATPALDKITLDTQASIKMVSEGSQGRMLAPGDTIHFTLDAAEPDGEATMDIGTAQLGIILQDRGDGTYSTDFIIPGGLEVIQAKVIGHFTDRAGNQATPINAQGTVTIQSPPPPVELRPPTPVGNSTTSLNLSWSLSGAEDFASYILLRAEEPGVDSTATLVTTITERTTTSFEDTELKENTDYWYRLYVFDQSGLSSASNQVKGTTKQDEPPEPVTLYPPSPVVGSFSQLNLSWSQNSDEDFASYNLYRSPSSGVDSSSILVTSITSQTTTAYQDTGLDENTSYYYRIYVWDKGGLAARSNEEEGRTNQDEPPEPVVLYSPNPISATQIDLSWSQSEERDFSSYRLFRSPSSGVDSTSWLAVTIREKFQTTYQDTGLDGNKTYYYRLFVYDQGGNGRGSNEVSATTENSSPEAVILAEIAVLDSASLGLSWGKNEEDDFQSYQVYRSRYSGVNLSSELIGEITDPSHTTLVDSGLVDNREYWYRVYVFDQGGLSAGSNEESGTTENSAPQQVSLSAPQDQQENSLTLSWTQNSNYDFSSYHLYRSLYPGVSSGSQLVGELPERTSTTYQDTNLVSNTTYYYRVYVVDTGDKASESNEVNGTTLPPQPPEPVELFSPSHPTESSLTLSWTSSQEQDFSAYRIYRSSSPGVDSLSLLDTTITNREVTSWVDHNLEENSTYYYRIFVWDRDGLSSGSNEVSGKTLENLPPQPVVLAQPVVEDSITLRLSWSENQDEDFATYRIFRSDSSPVDTTVAPIYIINLRETTEYLDNRLNTGQEYFYRVFVYDQGGLSAGSNEVGGTPGRGKR